MRKLLACILLLAGVLALVCGRLGDTIWAPPTSHSASVKLTNPGEAVVIEPGVLYAGGHEGTLTVTASGKVHLIPARKTDAEAYLAQTKYTAITGVPQWGKIATEVRNPDGKLDAADITRSDLWKSVTDLDSPAKFSIASWSEGETSKKNLQPYRSLIIVTDGKSSAASEITMTWPVNSKHAWVPYAYAGGAVLAILGLVLLLLALTSHKRDRDLTDDIDVSERVEPHVAPAPVETSGSIAYPGAAQLRAPSMRARTEENNTQGASPAITVNAEIDSEASKASLIEDEPTVENPATAAEQPGHQTESPIKASGRRRAVGPDETVRNLTADFTSGDER